MRGSVKVATVYPQFLMKNTPHFIAIIVLSITTAATCLAQDAAANQAAADGLAAAQMRQKLEAAYGKVRVMPEYGQAREAFRQAQETFQATQKKLMIQADPSLEAVFVGMAAAKNAQQAPINTVIPAAKVK